MRLLNVAALVCLLVHCFGFSILAQDEFTHEETKDFKARKLIGVGVTGVFSKTEFVMSDEHEINYDVMSLLKDKSSRKRMGISEDRYLELITARRELDKTIHTTYSTAFSEEDNDKIEALFFEAETKTRGMLGAEQLSMLKFERARKGVKLVGLDYLGSPSVSASFGLPEEAAKLIVERHKNYQKQLKATKLELLKAANRKLIASLSQSQLEKMEELIEEETRKKLVASALFVGEKVVRKKSTPQAKKSLFTVRLSSVERKLELSQEQIDRISLLEKDSPGLQDSINSILTDEQLAKLNQRTILLDLRKLGSVNSITSGLIGNRLALSTDEKDRMFELGKDLLAEFESELRQAAIDLAVEEFGLEEGQADRISSMLR